MDGAAGVGRRPVGPVGVPGRPGEVDGVEHRRAPVVPGAPAHVFTTRVADEPRSSEGAPARTQVGVFLRAGGSFVSTGPAR
ncbi:hypothetical protein [Streptomyces sp. NPDC055185]